MAHFGKLGMVLNPSEHIGVLNHNAGRLIINQVVEFVDRCLLFGIAIASGNFGIAELAIGFRHFAVMRMHPARQHGLFATCRTACHQDRLGTGRCPVPHRCVGHIHAGDRGNLCLEFKQILQRALGDFRLIRGIGRQKLATLDHVINSRRHVMAIGTSTQEAWHTRRTSILGRQSHHVAFDLHFAKMTWQINRGIKQRTVRNVMIKFFDRRCPDGFKHRRAVSAG